MYRLVFLQATMMASMILLILIPSLIVIGTLIIFCIKRHLQNKNANQYKNTIETLIKSFLFSIVVVLLFFILLAIILDLCGFYYM
jgi:heme/copper-type cytochrome/quinol oxidase subunit 2